MELHATIKSLRERAGLSQSEVAAACDVSRVAVTKWESGQTANLKLSNLVALCKLFRVSVEQLLNAHTKVAYDIDHTRLPVPPVVCERRHNDYAKSDEKSNGVFSPVLESAFLDLPDEGRAIVIAQMEIAIESARKLYGTRSKQTAA